MGDLSVGLATAPVADAEQRLAPAHLGKHTNIIIVGPPGAGKGTQADQLSAWLNVPHIASGEFFRAEQRAGTPLGLRAKTYLDQGLLVPDDLTSKMILERLRRPDCAHGFVLDGYPRTLQQAMMLDEAFRTGGRGRKIELVLLLAVREDVVLARLADRISCPNCGKVYNLRFNPPAVPGVCDRCGHELSVRSDDKLSTFQKRLQIYHDETLPMIQYYERRGLVESVDGEQEMDAVFRSLQEKITAHGKHQA